MSSYQGYSAASSHGYSQASTSSSTDPYAAFYYWDVNSNSWQFDYNSYYTTYGYPTDYNANAAHGDPSTAAQSANTYDAYTAASTSAAYSTNNTLTNPSNLSSDPFQPVPDKKPKEQPKFTEDGRFIPGKLNKGETRQTVLRKAAGKVWEDQMLLDWDPAHKRLFVGDLGNDVSDQTLANAFQKYPSFSKARVIRKKDEKTKGYGFVSFADPEDFLKAWKEMDGKYIGSRPCRLKRATESVNPVNIGAKKDKMLAISAKYDQQQYKTKMGGAIGKTLRRNGFGKPYGKP